MSAKCGMCYEDMDPAKPCEFCLAYYKRTGEFLTVAFIGTCRGQIRLFRHPVLMVNERLCCRIEVTRTLTAIAENMALTGELTEYTQEDMLKNDIVLLPE